RSPISASSVCRWHARTRPLLRPEHPFSLHRLYTTLSLCRVPLMFCIELAPDESNQGDQVHPNQQRDSGPDRAVHYVVAGEIAHIPGEAEGGKEPEDRREHCAPPDIAPSLAAVGTEIIQCGSDRHSGREGKHVASDAADGLPAFTERSQQGID